ncbi:MAG: hypothetical protein ABL933_16790 [Methyloglobulus sp.]|nr:hypothetical protein [Methyloglobulus sp.]
MNIKLIKFLAALCAGLCFLIACEWLYSVYAQKKLLESIQAVDGKKKSIAKLPALELAKQPEASYVELVNRPLFIQGRKPVPETATTKTPANVATGVFNWALNGVYTHKNSLYALFSRTNTKVAKDNFRKVTQNSEIDGWKLTEIHKDKVVVSQGDSQKELPLRKAKPKTPMSGMGQPPIAPPMPDPGQQFIPGQPPMPMPGQMPGMMPGQIPGQIPGQMPEPIPEPMPEPDPMIEPELLIPDQSSEPYFENSENEQFQ